MSYCRWSSDNWQCDLYCYLHVDGYYVTHVAGRKRIGEIPKVPDIFEVTPKEYFRAYKKQMKALEKTQLVPIGLAFDGETFEDDDLESFRNRLLWLRNEGYRFPDYVLEEVEMEIKESNMLKGGE